MEFRILGPLEVIQDGRPVALPGNREQAVLVLLLLSANQIVSAESLVDDLWGGEPPEAGVRALHVFVSRLRKALRAAGGESVVVTKGAGYAVEARPDTLDAIRFEMLVGEGRRLAAGGDPAGAAAVLGDALGLWRGPAVALSETGLAGAAGDRLDQLRLAALEERVGADLACGRHSELVPELDQLTKAHPLRERLWGQRMLALYRSGRQGDALRVYQDLRRLLAEELGVAPGPEVARLEGQILRHAPELDPPAGDGGAVPRNLPGFLTSFVGRAAELGELRTLITEARLLTLTGVGGAGKTRLAVEGANDALEWFPDGVWMVELAPVRDPADVPGAVAAALGFETSGVDAADGLTVRLARLLETRRALLLIDNCEHLVEAVARLVHSLLVGAPALRILATSRERLGLPGEVAWTVPPLSLPQPGASATDLEASDAGGFFRDRARSVRPGFEIDGDNAAAVARICRRLDGIPLALELAAARIQVISPEQLADRLDDRFSVLTGRDRIAVPRHQTLRATLDWSFDLLGAEEQSALAQLTVFPDTFDLEAAEAVIGSGPSPPDVLEVLSRLVDKSLLVLHSEGSTPRYRLLETIRQYGAEKLAERGEAAVTSRRHRDAFLTRAESWRGTHLGSEFLVGASADAESFFTALEWSWNEGELDAVLRLMGKLWLSWVWWGSPRSSVWIERALAAPEFDAPELADHPGQVDLLIIRAWFAPPGDDRAQRQNALLERAAALTAHDGLSEPATRVAWIRGEFLLLQGDVAGARPLLEAGLAGFEQLGLPDGIACGHDHLGWLAVAEQDYDEARHQFQLAVDAACSDPLGAWLAPHALAALAPLVALTGDVEHAARLADEAVESARRLGARPVLAMALTRVAETLILSSSPESAVPVVLELLRVLTELGSQRWLGDALEVAAVILGERDETEGAALMLGACSAMRQASGETGAGIRPIAGQVGRVRNVLVGAMGRERFEQEELRGRALPADRAMAEAASRLRPQ